MIRRRDEHRCRRRGSQKSPGGRRDTLRACLFQRFHTMMPSITTRQRLGGIVDQDVDSREALGHVLAETFHGAQVCQFQSKQFQSKPPVLEVRLLRISLRGIVRIPCGCDNMGPGTKKLQHNHVANPDAATGHHAYIAGQVGRLRPLVIVVIAAPYTKLMVEVVDLAEVTLANQALPPKVAGRDASRLLAHSSSIGLSRLAG
mmetsp:Transcript_29442/g.80520  ORF Transcript_29442/g.80520 Transcript_29442/m.80520 type:complete len:202 (-) Transcript_29442:642-1247(-)